MPIRLIRVPEYECIHCHYIWVNRTNGKDGPLPKSCAKCRSKTWNGRFTKGEEAGSIEPDM